MTTTIGDGIAVVDKPGGMTSHDVVSRVRRAAGTRKVGHAGTLDPMATGLLVLGLNRATRLLTYLVGADKRYLATIRLGQGTITDDAEGEVTAAPGWDGASPQRLHEAIAGLTGDIDQVPSSVSAIKVDGKRSYARVRAGEEVALAPRPVTVSSFDLLGSAQARAVDGTEVVDLDVAVRCSSGTYIRALARDLGAALGSAGHLTALRRTDVGQFTLEDAQTFDELADGVALLSMSDVARRVFPVREMSDGEVREVRFGRSVPPTEAGGVVAAFAPDGHVVALLSDRGEHARPVLVLDPA